MTLRSPIVAMLWENWRLTRVEAAWKLALGIVAGLAALVAFAAMSWVPNQAVRDFGAVIALIVIVLPNIMGWWSIGNLNRLRPGFPFYLLYTRPVRTPVLVGVSMTYQSAVPAVSYLVSALLLRVTSGYPFPLVPVAAWIAALNLSHAPTNWPFLNAAVRLLVNLAAALAWFFLAMHRLTPKIPGWDWTRPMQWPTVFDFPPTYYALFVVIGVASFAIAVVGVARQRRGDAPAAVPWTPGTGFPEGLVNLFRFRCPTSSATWAQVWFDLKSGGLPVLTIGVVLAILNPLVFAISVPAVWFRPIAVMCGLASVWLAVLTVGGNAFGIRRKQGRVYASEFEATQACGTARMATLKVLVRSVCGLVALVAVGMSVWASLSFIAFGQGYEPLRSWQGAIESAVGALNGYQLAALAVVVSIGAIVMVASLASFAALAARYPRRFGVVGLLLLLHGAVLIPLVLTGYRGVGSQALWEFLVNALVWMTRWIDAPLIVAATVYVCWNAFDERLLTLRSAGGAVLISAAFGAAWLTMLRAAGVQLAGTSMPYAFWMLSPLLLPLMASALAPWSLSRVRHT
jgi:hypothetical protein